MLLGQTVTQKGGNIMANLIMIDMPDFDVILYMDFLSHYGAEIDYQKKKVKFHLDDGEKFTFNKDHVLSLMINNIKVKKLLNKGCTCYLVHVVGKDMSSILSFQSTLIVCEFQDVFLDKLSGLALEIKIEFSIKLVLRTVPISKALYKMASTELQELKNQWQKLLDIRFIKKIIHHGVHRSSL